MITAMNAFGQHGTRWVVIVLVAMGVSIGLRVLARWGTQRGIDRLAAARRALGLGDRGRGIDRPPGEG
jgi:hypothetical protein